MDLRKHLLKKFLINKVIVFLVLDLTFFRKQNISCIYLNWLKSLNKVSLLNSLNCETKSKESSIGLNISNPNFVINLFYFSQIPVNPCLKDKCALIIFHLFTLNSSLNLNSQNNSNSFFPLDKLLLEENSQLDPTYSK
jgi:hypothetical protein